MGVSEVSLRLKSGTLMASVTERFAARSAAAAQPGLRSLENHLIGGVPDGDLSLQMQRPVCSRYQPQLSAGCHLLASVYARCNVAGIIECHGEVAVVAEGLVLRSATTAQCRSRVRQQLF